MTKKCNKNTKKYFVNGGKSSESQNKIKKDDKR